MFENLFDFGYKRTGLQALGFYIVYFIFALIFGAIIVHIVPTNAQSFKENFIVGAKIGSIFIILYVFVLSLIIIISKKIYSNIQALLLLLIVAPIFSILLGGLLGMIVPAVLTTFENKNIEVNEEEVKEIK